MLILTTRGPPIDFQAAMIDVESCVLLKSPVVLESRVGLESCVVLKSCVVLESCAVPEAQTQQPLLLLQYSRVASLEVQRRPHTLHMLPHLLASQLGTRIVWNLKLTPKYVPASSKFHNLTRDNRQLAIH